MDHYDFLLIYFHSGIFRPLGNQGYCFPYTPGWLKPIQFFFANEAKNKGLELQLSQALPLYPSFITSNNSLQS